MFKPANHNSRIPSILQAYTKENLIFQLSLVGLFVVGMWVKDVIDDRKLNKQLDRSDPIA